MTAPLTPHDHSSHLPPYPGSGASGPDQGEDRTKAVLSEVRRGALVALLVTVCGVALGLLWLWLSPRVPLVSDGRAVYLKDTEGEEAIGGDGTFALIAAGLGILTAAAVFWRYRRGGIGVVLGLAAGGVLASLVGWRLGVWLGPDTDIVAHATAVGPKVVFDAPLELRAKSALVAWPIAAMVVHLVLTSAFGPRDPDVPGAKSLYPAWTPPPPPNPSAPPPPPHDE
ncbi:ABC transporter permease [Actinacidiphila bryophytorum]|uniref:ABC transporter permease n=1 Tax=Actinacidiphila bryophytorum TaxID=1436133 RepID=UPI0021769932|nr:ABC transporter permease [Actinacidiphila bryophytorum]UWE08948.1 ABC transporter permease [Actinacidiphila bryophytorum]